MPVPKIDDEYWFTYSDGLVTKSQERVEQAAEKIQNLVVWLWGIYTTLTTIGFALSKKNFGVWPTLVIASTSIAIIAVYWGTVWVRVPKLVQFDPRSPDDIKDAYTAAASARYRRLQITLVLSLLAAAMVSISLIVGSVAKEHSDPTSPSLEAVLHVNDNHSDVAVTAHVGKGSEATVIIKAADGANLNVPAARILPSEGLVQTSISVPGKVTSVRVVIEWPEGELTWQIAKVVTVSKSESAK